jgi:hypothetical protein
MYLPSSVMWRGDGDGRRGWMVEGDVHKIINWVRARREENDER